MKVLLLHHLRPHFETVMALTENLRHSHSIYLHSDSLHWFSREQVVEKRNYQLHSSGTIYDLVVLISGDYDLRHHDLDCELWNILCQVPVVKILHRFDAKSLSLQGPSMFLFPKAARPFIPVETGLSDDVLFEKRFGVRPSFLIQGNIEDRRSYDLIPLLAEKYPSADFLIVGQKVTESKFSSRNIFLFANLSELDFHSHCQSSTFILPLIEPDLYPGYFNDRFSSSIQVGLSYSIPFIAHRSLFELYDINGLSYLTFDELCNCIGTAISMTVSEYSKHVKSLRTAKSAYLQRNLENFNHLAESADVSPSWVLGWWQKWVESLRSTRNYNDAEFQVSRAIMSLPGEAWPFVQKTHILLDKGNWVEAAREADFIVTRYPDLSTGYQLGARALRNLRSYHESEALLEKAKALFPGEQWPWADMVTISLDQRDWEDAILRAQEARERFPNHSAGYSLGVRALRSAKKFADATALLERSGKLFPRESWPLTEIAWVAMDQADWLTAIERAAFAQKRFPHHSSGYSVGVRAMRNARQYEEAETLLHKAKVLFPRENWPVLDLAWIAIERADWQEAIERAAAARCAAPAQSAGYLVAVKAFRKMRRRQEAESLLREAADIFRHESWPLTEMAWVAIDDSDWDEGIRRAMAAMELFPRQESGLVVAVAALRGAGRNQEAARLVDEAKGVFPNVK